MKPTFEQVKMFLLSWGLSPDEEPDDNHIGSNDGYTINSSCYAKMCDEAHSTYGEEFRKFLSHSIDATDGAFYLTADTWADMEVEYNS
jgi:hypothetical protein